MATEVGRSFARSFLKLYQSVRRRAHYLSTAVRHLRQSSEAELVQLEAGKRMRKEEVVGRCFHLEAAGFCCSLLLRLHPIELWTNNLTA